jgi:phosphoglycolate phosphatase
LDGTLVDSTNALEEAANIALSSIGFRQNYENIGTKIARCFQRNNSAAALSNFFDKVNLSKSSREDFLSIFLQSFYEIAPEKTQMFPNVDETLCKLSRIFPLALVTRRTIVKNRVKEELERLHLFRYFAIIVTSHEVKRPSPFIDAFLKAAERMHVPIRSCVVVSDSGVDIRAGKSAGAKTIAVLSGLFSEEELRKEKPDLIIRNVNYLPIHLLKT